MESLTLQQSAFVDAYLGDAEGNPTQAARMAGFPDSKASRAGAFLMEQPKIRSEIESRLAGRGITPHRILNLLASIAENPQEATKDRISAMRLLGQYMGLDQQRIHVEQTVRTELSAKDVSSILDVAVSETYGVTEAEIVGEDL